MVELHNILVWVYIANAVALFAIFIAIMLLMAFKIKYELDMKVIYQIIIVCAVTFAIALVIKNTALEEEAVTTIYIERCTG